MNNEEFLKNINKDLSIGKKELQDKSEEVIKELNDYRKYLDEELEREKNGFSYKDCVNEDYKTLVYSDADYGNVLDFEEIDDEEYDIIADVAMRDPMFALNFLERRKSEIPSDKYTEMREMLYKKLDF